MSLDWETHYETLKAHALLVDDLVSLYECLFDEDRHADVEAIKVLRGIATVFATIGRKDKVRQLESKPFFSDDYADYVRCMVLREGLVPSNVIKFLRPPADLWDIYRDKSTLETYVRRLEELADAVKVLVELLRKHEIVLGSVTGRQDQERETVRVD